MLQYLWALPLTLLGLLMAACVWFFDKKQRIVSVNTAQGATVFIVHGKMMSKLLCRHPMGSMLAMALGCCILARDEATAQDTLTHELVHVEQALRWGPLFPLVYALASVWARAHGGCAYRDNVFEKAAFAAEKLC